LLERKRLQIFVFLQIPAAFVVVHNAHIDKHKQTRGEAMNSEMALTIKDVMRQTGLSRTSIYRMEKDGRFPNRKRFGLISVRWLQSEITAFIVSRTNAA
jgi:prophage regulatory protein